MQTMHFDGPHGNKKIAVRCDDLPNKHLQRKNKVDGRNPARYQYSHVMVIK
jgi:hypothetical protein